MVPCKSTAEKVSFEWSHQRILSTDSKVRTTLHVSITDSWNEKGKEEKSITLNIHSAVLTLVLQKYLLK